jgi:hypothetical protein
MSLDESIDVGLGERRIALFAGFEPEGFARDLVEA